MPANHPIDARRGNNGHGGGSARAPQMLFWAGMVLAPVAVLVLLFGQSSGALRAAVVLAVLTIVLLAVSMAIRPSIDLVRVDIEHRVLDEMERIRLRAQNESAHAVRQSQRAITDHIHALNETISDLRAQVDEVQAIAYVEPHGPAALGAGPAPGPGVRRTETVHVTRRTTYDDTGTVYGSRAAHEGARAVEGEWRERYEDERGWSPDRPGQRALPASHGEPVGYYTDDRGQYDDRGQQDDRGQYDDRGRHDDRGRDRYDDRGGHDRDRGGYERDRAGYDRERGGYDRDRGGYDRDRGGYDRDRGGYDHGRGGHERDRGGYDRDRGYDDRDRHDDRRHDERRGDDRRYDDRGHMHRQRSSEW